MAAPQLWCDHMGDFGQVAQLLWNGQSTCKMGLSQVIPKGSLVLKNFMTSSMTLLPFLHILSVGRSSLPPFQLVHQLSPPFHSFCSKAQSHLNHLMSTQQQQDPAFSILFLSQKHQIIKNIFLKTFLLWYYSHQKSTMAFQFLPNKALILCLVFQHLSRLV